MASNGASKTTIVTQVATILTVALALWAGNSKVNDLQSKLATAQVDVTALNTKIAHLGAKVTRLQHIKAEIIAAIRQVVRDHLHHQTSALVPPAQATLASSRVPRLCWNRRITKFGSAGGDIIFGTNGNDVIWSGPGDDAVFGDGGNDRICGGTGDDTLVGDPGNDRVTGGPGDDQCVAERTRKCES